jgi:hypothetical protein
MSSQDQGISMRFDMRDYLEWLTAGLVFFWILGTYETRAASPGPESVQCEAPSSSGAGTASASSKPVRGFS